MLWPVTFAEVAEAGPLNRRAGLFSIFWLYFGVGQLLGPFLGGFLGENFSLRAPSFAAAWASLVWVPAAAMVRRGRAVVRNPLRPYAGLPHLAPRVGLV